MLKNMAVKGYGCDYMLVMHDKKCFKMHVL